MQYNSTRMTINDIKNTSPLSNTMQLSAWADIYYA